MNCEYEDKIFPWQNADFVSLALNQFRFQYRENDLYRQYANALGRDPGNVQSLTEIPFLPVHFFKSHSIKTGSFTDEMVFESSGTTKSGNSRHYIKDLSLYRDSFTKGFNLFYGSASDWCIIGLLPSYLERENSSLVFMVDELIRHSGHPQSGFYLNEYAKLAELLQDLENKQQKTLLIGVSFALLDFAAAYPMPLKHTVIMETGGMKGRRRELTRHELHHLLKTAFQQDQIHAEYGMTELLSQAYSKEKGLFYCPPWMKVLIREEDDALSVYSNNDLDGKEMVNGLINVIDLANLYSCSFIAVDDIGRLYRDGSFEVMGRRDHADLRGCSLMTEYPVK